MLWEQIERLKKKDFRRKTGVKRGTFSERVHEVKEAKKNRPTQRGQAGRFSAEDRVLILLKYYREYGTYLSIAAEVGTSQSNVCRIVQATEEILVKSKKFRLPGKKVLRSDVTFEVIVVDATETKIERPKKRGFARSNRSGIEKISRSDSIREKRSTTT